jgi:hypothetical protein
MDKECDVCQQEVEAVFRWREFLGEDQWVCKECLMDLRERGPRRGEA